MKKLLNEEKNGSLAKPIIILGQFGNMLRQLGLHMRGL
jgi:hypothetical protein